MIALRCSNRATLDLAARINLRVNDLWRELDAVQLEIADLPYLYHNPEYSRLERREREIFAELDRIDD